MRHRLVGVLTIAFLLVCSTDEVFADEVSGTWTGVIEGRGNYFWERSTRVVVPEIELKLVAPNGVRMGVGYLVDVISSASIAQTGSDIDAVFTEYRHGVHADVGKELDLGDAQIDPSLHATYSTEDDYDSLIYGGGADLSWDDRNSKLSLGLSVVTDSIHANNDPSFDGELDGVTTSIGFERVLSRTVVLGFGYQVGYLEGFLGNAYRRVVFAEGAPVREAPPDSRVRHNAIVRLGIFVPPTRTALHFGYRAYIDSWDIGALTPELRVTQEIGRDTLVSAHYRMYVQTAAWFVAPGGQYTDSGETHAGPTTNDPKLDELTNHTFGLGFEQRLGFLEDTVLDFASNGAIDIAVDRYLTTSTFGNGVIATAGGRLPF